MPESQLSSSARKVQDALHERGLEVQVRELPASTRTAAEAAKAVGCAVAQIAKSLVFRGRQTGKAILVIASGANRVDLDALSAAVAEPVELADPDFVRLHTGFAIGGVPPVGHAQTLPTLIDEDLLNCDPIWAAAGTPRAIFPISPSELTRLTAGRVLPLREGSSMEPGT